MKRFLLTCFTVVCIAGFNNAAFAQDRTVSGTVTSAEDGSPIPGVSVVLEGTTIGSQTDGEGKYSLSVPEKGGVLVFSFIGLKTQKITIGNQSTINPSLENDATELGEILVSTSFGIERDKKKLGYGTTTINSGDLTAAKVTNVTNALVGKIPGVQVSGTGGAFTGSSVIIRGFTTFTGSNQPLYVVDGMPIDNSGGGTALQSGPSASNRAIDINPEDIESVNVLKGAAATALYGSRAASGVIQITTKKASKGSKNRVSYSTSYNIGQVNRLPDYQNEYAQGSGGVFQPGNVNTATALGLGGGSGSASSWGPKITGQTVTNFFGDSETLKAYPDNVKDIFQNAYNWQNNLSFSGSSNKTSYRVSYGNVTETYVLDNNKLKRHNLTVNANSEITSKLSVGTSFTYTNTSSQRTQQGNQLANPLFRAYFTPRSYDLTNLPFENAEGKQLWYGGEDHPYWTIKRNTYDDEVNRIYGNINARYDFTEWLFADVKIGTDFYNLKSKGFDEKGTRGGGNSGAAQSNGGSIVERDNAVRNTNSYITLSANKGFGDFNLIATVGNEINQNYSTSSTVTGYNLVLPGFNNMKNTISYLPSFGSTKTRLIGVFADVVVDYKNYLTLNLRARNDWSSTLSKDNRSIFYPAVALSFVATEAFSSLKTDKINLVKVRANIGEVGKGAGAYSTDSYYIVPTPGDGFTTGIRFPYNGLAAYSLSNGAGNPNITPEFTREIELGLELGFFNNRITFDGSIYQRKTRNVILSAPFSNASGITSAVINAGKLTTNGIEFALGVTPIKKNNFSWDISMVFTKFKSVVDELAPGVDVIGLGGFVDPNVRLVAGQQYGQLYGYKYQRNDQGQLLIGANGLPLREANLSVIGNPNPDYLIGITNTVNYKSLSFSFLIDIRKGGDQYSRNIADVRRNGVAIETAKYPRFEEDNVTPTTPYLFEGVYAPGTPNAGQPNTTQVRSEQYWGNSGVHVAGEGFIFDTSWIRLREAALTYTFPKSMLSNTPIGNLEVGLFGRNIFMHAPNYPHFDPEQNALGVSNAQGLEFNSLPATRTFGANLKVTF